MTLDATKPADATSFLSEVAAYLRETRAYINALTVGGVGADGDDGEDAKYVRISGVQYFLFIPSQSNPVIENITLTANLFGGLTTYDWEYWTGAVWANLSGTQNAQTYTLNYLNAAWGTSKHLRVRCQSEGYYDEMTIVKLYDGDTGYTVILTNETHTIACDSDGTPKAGELAKAITSIKVFQGATEFTAVGEGDNVTFGTFKYVITDDTDCVAARIDDSSFGLSSADADSGSVTIDVYCENPLTAIEKIFTFTKARAGVDGLDGADGADGADGVASRAVNLTVDAQGFTYNSAGATPSPASGTVTATALNTVGTPYYKWYINDVFTGQNTTSNTLAYTPPASIADMPQKIEVELREGSGDSAILARDQITIFGLREGGDGITTVLSNESHTVPVDSGGTVDYTASGTDIRVWLGATPLQYGAGGAGVPYFTVAASVASGTITIGGATIESTYIRRFAQHSAMTTDLAMIQFTITVVDAAGSSVEITRFQTITKSHDGADGADGSDGPGLTYRGDWAANTAYIGTASVRDVVKYSGNYYTCQTSHTSGAVFEGGYWSAFGASFSSVATDLLLAQDVYITKRLYFTGTDSQIVVTGEGGLEIDSPGGLKMLGGSSIEMDEPALISISSITNANPAVVTAPTHGLSNGDKIRFVDMPAGNYWDTMDYYLYIVTVIDEHTFSVPQDTRVSEGWVAYSGGDGKCIQVIPSYIEFPSTWGASASTKMYIGTAPGYWANGLFIYPAGDYEGYVRFGANPEANIGVDQRRLLEFDVWADYMYFYARNDGDSYNTGIIFTGPDGGTVTFTEGMIRLANATAAPTGSGKQGFYASGGELYAIDSAGNASLLSPHKFDLFTPSVEFESPWSYVSENKFLGKQVEADMFGALRAIEKIYEKVFDEKLTLIHLKDIPKLNWEREQDKLEKEYNDRLASIPFDKRQQEPPFVREPIPQYIKDRLDYEKHQVVDI